MKEIPVPADALAREKKAASLNRGYRAAYVLFYILLALSILALVGLVVVLLVFGLKEGGGVLFYALLGSFSGAILVCSPCAYLMTKALDALLKRKTDYAERCDGEESFFVGDETLATFSGNELVLHRGGGKIKVPYEDIRFFSVCTRRAPSERGEWSVIFEIPARYLSKKPEKNAPPVLVQADAKERLYRTLQNHGLPLLGEQPPKTKPSGKKFKRRFAFAIPDPRGRKRGVFQLIGGFALLVGGVLVAVFWQPTVGSVLAAVGVLLMLRGGGAFLRAKRMVALFDEGFYWKEESYADRVFLKWEEIVSVKKDGEWLRVACAYGAYRFPEAGSFEEIEREHPTLCKNS